MNPTQELEFTCLICKKVNTRAVRVIEPEKFSPTGSRSVLYHGRCVHCKEPLALRYEFYRDAKKEVQVRVKEKLNADEVFKPRKPETGITIRPKASTRRNRR